MLRRTKLIMLMAVMLGLVCTGCAPSTFVKGQSAGWKTIVLNDTVKGDYAAAWSKTVDTIARDYNRYRGRITIKYANTEVPDQVEVKTDAQWMGDTMWVEGFDKLFNRDVYVNLSGILGRTVPTD